MSVLFSGPKYLKSDYLICKSEL